MHYIYIYIFFWIRIPNYLSHALIIIFFLLHSNEILFVITFYYFSINPIRKRSVFPLAPKKESILMEIREDKRGYLCSYSDFSLDVRSLDVYRSIVEF